MGIPWDGNGTDKYVPWTTLQMMLACDYWLFAKISMFSCCWYFEL